MRPASLCLCISKQGMKVAGSTMGSAGSGPRGWSGLVSGSVRGERLAVALVAERGVRGTASTRYARRARVRVDREVCREPALSESGA